MDTLNLRPSTMGVGVEAPRRDEFIHEHPRSSVPELRCMGLMSTHRAGESCGDRSVKSCSTNHTEVRRVDKVIGDRRREDTFTIFVTACLLSVALAALAIESYNMLSLDFCDEFMPLSTHIPSLSQEPVNASESKVTPCHWNDVAFQGNAPFKPLASAIRTIAFSLSLVLILATVLSAALPQLQRLISEIAGGSGPPARPVETALHVPLFLSLSVFLFIAGLFDFLLSINETVAFCVLGSVPALPFVYLVCTALPILCPCEGRHDSRPRFVWRVSQILGLVVLVAIGQIGDMFTMLCHRLGIRLFCAQLSTLVLRPR